MKHLILASALLAATAPFAFAEGTPSPEGATVYFINLDEGSEVQSPVHVLFGLQGMGVAPAGVEQENTGHHHLYVNRAAFGDDAGDDEIEANGIPADSMHLHFGGGQTETMLDLSPGQHTLQLVLGDHFHVPHDPPVVSQQITITVTE